MTISDELDEVLAGREVKIVDDSSPASGVAGHAENKYGPSQDDDSGKKSASTLLVELALKRYKFGCTEEGQPFAVKPGGHVRMLRGGKNSLRAELSKEYYREHKKAAPQQALDCP